MARKIHWDLYKRRGLECCEKWHEHKPEGVVENDCFRLLWDMNIQCDNEIGAQRPDLIIIDKKEHTIKAIIIDIAVPADVNVEDKEKEKIEKYQDLKREIKRLWKLKKAKVIPVVIGSLGCVTKKFDKWIERLEIDINLGVLQMTALLGTARLLRKIWEL